MPPDDANRGLLRSTGAALPATVLGAPNGWAEVVLDRPEAGISPGQACVIYQGDRLVGGGWIVATEAARPESHRDRGAIPLTLPSPQGEGC